MSTRHRRIGRFEKQSYITYQPVKENILKEQVMTLGMDYLKIIFKKYVKVIITSFILCTLFIESSIYANTVSMLLPEYLINPEKIAYTNIGVGKFEKDLISKISSALFIRKEYDKLIKLGDALRNNKSRSIDGKWKLDYYYQGLNFKELRKEDDWHSAFISFIKSYSNNPAPYICYAAALVSKGWSFRGGGYANTVTEDGWKKFNKHLEVARNLLLYSKEISSTCPEWYTEILIVAMAEDWDMESYNKVYKEGIERHNNYHGIYYQGVQNNLERWGGTVSSMDEIIRESNELSKKDYGDEYYYRLKWLHYQIEGEIAFKKYEFNWDQYKKGYFDLEKRFPKSNKNLNWFTFFCCLHKDKETAVKLFKRIGTNIYLKPWGSLEKFEEYKTWAEE